MIGVVGGYGHTNMNLGAIKSVSYVLLDFKLVFRFVFDTQGKSYGTPNITAF